MIKKIIMKTGTSKAKFLAFASWLEQRGKLISSAEKTEDGRFVAIACFEDGIDYLAFLVATGFVKMFAVDKEVQPGNPSGQAVAQAAEEKEELKGAVKMKALKCKDCGKTCYSSSSGGTCPRCGGELEEVKGQ